MKAHYLSHPMPTGDLVAVLPNIRDSDPLTPAMLRHLVRVLKLTGFEDEIGGPK